jgi:hypothetical protein
VRIKNALCHKKVEYFDRQIKNIEENIEITKTQLSKLAKK